MGNLVLLERAADFAILAEMEIAARRSLQEILEVGSPIFVGLGRWLQAMARKTADPIARQRAVF
jgi:hypothetical protein